MSTANKNILRFLIKCLLLILPVLAIWWISYFKPMHVLEYDYALWMQQKDYIENNNDYNRIVILGDSSAQFNIDIERGWDDTRILAVGAMRMPALYYSLKNYLESHPAPEAVILSVTYDRFYGDYDEFLSKGICFHYLNRNEIKEILDTSRQVGSSLLENVSNYEMIRYYYRTPDLFALEALRTLTGGAAGRNEEIYKETTKRKGSYSYSAPDYSITQVTKSAEDGKIYMDPLMISYLDRMIEICDKNSIKLIMVQAPMNKASYEKLDQEWIDQFNAMMEPFEGRLIEENELPVYPNEYFYSSNHMNKKGIEHYTEDLLHKIEEYLQDK